MKVLLTPYILSRVTLVAPTLYEAAVEVVLKFQGPLDELAPAVGKLKKVLDQIDHSLFSDLGVRHE